MKHYFHDDVLYMHEEIRGSDKQFCYLPHTLNNEASLRGFRAFYSLMIIQIHSRVTNKRIDAFVFPNRYAYFGKF